MELPSLRYLLRALSCVFAVLFLRGSQTVGAVKNKNIFVNWTSAWVNTRSSPLDVRVGDVLQFRCEEDDEESTVFALEEEEFANISRACTAASLTPSIASCPNIHQPRIPLTDCRNPSPEYEIRPGLSHIDSCRLAGNFFPGRLYYLINLREEKSRCLFALPVRICDLECGQASSTPSPLPSLSPSTSPLPSLSPSTSPLPSLSPSLSLALSLSSSVLASVEGSGSGSGYVTNTLQATRTPTISPSMIPTISSSTRLPSSAVTICALAMILAWNHSM